MSREELLPRIQGADTPWAACVALLEYWRGRPRGHAIARDSFGDHHSEWSKLENEVVIHFEERLSRTLRLTEEDKNQIETWIGPKADFDRVHAVAWGIDEAGFATFPLAWKETLTLVDGCYELRWGDAYPLGELDSADVDGEELATRPHAATDPRGNDLPHVRIFEKPACKWVDHVVLDFRRWDRLETLFSTLDEIATIHPNEHISEWMETAGASMFPVELRNPTLQPERYRRLVAMVRETDFSAKLVVAPELSATEETVTLLQSDLDAGETDGAMIVCGSRHLLDCGTPTNRMAALLPDREPIVHDKIVPVRRTGFRQPERVEGIARRSTLRIHQAGRFRFALLVCKDFLDSDLLGVLSRLGVNVVAVPAMSPKTRRFGSGAERLVDETQAIVIVANGPYKWGSRIASPAAFFSQPVESDPVVRGGPHGECCTGCAWFKLGGHSSTWLSVRF